MPPKVQIAMQQAMQKKHKKLNIFYFLFFSWRVYFLSRFEALNPSIWTNNEKVMENLVLGAI